jgi:hypothetical protein
MPEFPYHNQGDNETCGAACLMMMLESTGLLLAGMRQSGLLTATESASIMPQDDYYSPPEAMVAVANQLLNGIPASALPKVRYKVFPAGINPLQHTTAAAANDDECIAAIRAGLNTGAPVFLLANGGSHWVLIYKRPQKYYIRWPFVGPGTVLNGTHGAPPCNLCTAGFEDRRTKGAVLSALAEVLGMYADPPGYVGQRILLVPQTVAIVTPQPLVAQSAAPDGAGNSDSEPPVVPRAQPVPAQGEKEEDEDPRPAVLPLTEKSAQAFVQSQLAGFADSFELHGALLLHATAGPAIRVHYLGNSKRDYFLVPVFAKAASLPHFVAQVGAAAGDLGISSIRTNAPAKDQWVFTAPAKGAMVAEGWKYNDRLVWQPCLQSLTPLQPFVEVKRQSDGAIGFSDLTGKVHPELSPVDPRRAQGKETGERKCDQ